MFKYVWIIIFVFFLILLIGITIYTLKKTYNDCKMNYNEFNFDDFLNEYFDNEYGIIFVIWTVFLFIIFISSGFLYLSEKDAIQFMEEVPK